MKKSTLTTLKQSFVILFIITVVIIWGRNSSNGMSEPKTYSDNDAFFVSQDYVKSHLRSPSTAKFCKLKDVVFRETTYGVAVSAYLDSQNGYGAMIRTEYTVIVEFKNDTANFSEMVFR